MIVVPSQQTVITLSITTIARHHGKQGERNEKRREVRRQEAVRETQQKFQRPKQECIMRAEQGQLMMLVLHTSREFWRKVRSSHHGSPNSRKLVLNEAMRPNSPSRRHGVTPHEEMVFGVSGSTVQYT